MNEIRLASVSRCRSHFMRVGRAGFGAATAILLGWGPSSHAEIVRIAIDARAPVNDPTGGDAAKGYEEIRGRLFGEVDPKAAGNRIIQDIGLAPVNARGKVEYISTFRMLRPVDPKKSAGVLFSPLPNRGGQGVASWRRGSGIDPVYYDRGWSVVWVGWQGDLRERPQADVSASDLKLESISVPVARKRDGSSITGRYLVRVPTVGGRGPSGAIMKLDQGGAGSLAYMPATFDTGRAVLTGGPAENSEGKPSGPRYTVSPQDWVWWDCALDSTPGAATKPGDLCVKRVKGSFSPDEAYLLVFDVKDPLVLGLGMAAIRDGVSFFRYGVADKSGTPNPMTGQVKVAIGQGVSQVGNFAKTLVALGFNRDEQGRRVWDGVHAHIAGRRTPINYRFSTPGSSASLYMPGSEGVLWWGKAADGVRGGPAVSLLDRCHATNSCPKVFETFGGAELWNQRMTPGMVNFNLKKDIALPAEVRRYYFPGTQHGGGAGGFRLSTGGAGCELPANANPETDQVRALTVALVDWVSGGKEPPASAYPMLARGELVRDLPDTYKFPALPGVKAPFNLANPVLLYDYGSKFNYRDMSGIIGRQPPAIRGVVPALVPQVDVDGNETSGIPSIQLMAPIGTFLSWNRYEKGPYAGQICSFNGGFVPFAKTRADRDASGDPRLSIEERYKNRHGYVAAVRTATQKAQSDGFLLPADAERLVKEATEATETGDLGFLKP